MERDARAWVSTRSRREAIGEQREREDLENRSRRHEPERPRRINGVDAGVLHFTLSERVARGRAARAAASRRSHAALDLPANRDPIAWLEAQAGTRVAELVPIRYSRMLTSPLAFFRGAATVMAHDLAAALRTDLNVQLCGDAHLLNFGGFSSPERETRVRPQ